ncbi:MAG: MFS transporter [Ignavibacteriales bacterium]|nr:MAG: MFS transporter [Ignavibacteriales bacterium]
MSKSRQKNPWSWIPSLYFAEGLPYVAVMTISVIMYKRLGISNTDIALYTSWLYLPWVIKPLWSPIVDNISTKRFWTISMQLVIGVSFGAIGLSIPAPDFFRYTLIFFWLVAFSSATHDIAADGFYMLGLSKHQQAFFVGIRSLFYRFAMIFGQGILIIFAGYLESSSGFKTTITVNADSVSVIQHIDAESFVAKNDSTLKDFRILTSVSEIKLNYKNVPSSYADSLISFAKNWNEENNFTEKPIATTNTGTNLEAEPSWFRKHFVIPLEEFLRNNFGENKFNVEQTDSTGNIALVWIGISKFDNEQDELIVHVDQTSGDKSISLVSSGRYSFNKNNFNKPAAVLIQLDHKLSESTDAEFTVQSGNITSAWSISFYLLAVMFIAFFVYHKIMLPHPAEDYKRSISNTPELFRNFFSTFVIFFKKKNVIAAIGFILLYRFAEAQLVKLAAPFLLDNFSKGGLNLTTGQVGFVYGTVGVAALAAGGILGGVVASRNGLKYWMWWMIAAINIPDLVYVFLSFTQPADFILINVCVAIEQFGYGFGFTAFLLYLIYISDGEHKTSHYAIATGIMALGMMLPGMFSGWLQELIGYKSFFVWVCISTIPCFMMALFVKVDPEFGKKHEN